VKGDLRPLGRRLGADVPFFLQPHPLALGRGIGDVLSPVPARGGPWWIVVVYPGVGVSTPEAYRRLKLRPGAALTTRRLLTRLKSSLRAGAPPSVWSEFLFNRLEEPVFRLCKASADARRELDALGARGRLSGSGSCVFAVAPDAVAARRWAKSLERLRRPGWKVYVTRVG
jgi:4-diphosphocytidyl-2-C-methyl-D-erythritol kinase